MDGYINRTEPERLLFFLLIIPDPPEKKSENLFGTPDPSSLVRSTLWYFIRQGNVRRHAVPLGHLHRTGRPGSGQPNQAFPYDGSGA